MVIIKSTFVDVPIAFISQHSISKLDIKEVLNEHKVNMDKLIEYNPVILNTIMHRNLQNARSKYGRPRKQGLTPVAENTMDLAEIFLTVLYFHLSHVDHAPAIIFSFTHNNDGSLSLQWRDAGDGSIRVRIHQEIVVSASVGDEQIEITIQKLSEIQDLADWSTKHLR